MFRDGRERRAKGDGVGLRQKIVQVLGGGDKIDVLLESIQLCSNIFLEGRMFHFVVKAAIALVGDIAQAMGSEASIKNQIRQPFVEQLLKDGAQSPNESTREISSWAMQQIA